MILSDPPKLGDKVIYFDEDKQPFAAIVAHVYAGFIKEVNRPVCNLAIFTRDGTVRRGLKIQPAYHNGERWMIICRWAYADEIPASESDNGCEASLGKAAEVPFAGPGVTLSRK